MSRPKLSIVIPYLNEVSSLPLLIDALHAQPGMPEDHELIFVSDGSTDGSNEFLAEAANSDSRIKLVVLTRNFGHQSAVSAGLTYASGRYVAIMDADLQDEPEALIGMYKKIREENLDMVYAIRKSRRGSLLKRGLYRVFYKFYGALSESPVHMSSGDFCIMTDLAVSKLNALPEKVRFVRGLRSWLGLKEAAYVIGVRPNRIAGKPQYTFGKLFKLAFHGLTAFSTAPLRFSMYSGLVMFLGALAAAVFYLIAGLFFGVQSKVPGFTTLIIMQLLLNGFVLLNIGIVGEYLAQIFTEVKGRPPYLIDYTVNLDDLRDSH